MAEHPDCDDTPTASVGITGPTELEVDEDVDVTIVRGLETMIVEAMLEQ
ncbi:hypothetical protein [Solemya elarraichensis gill symbiont]|nr:hypothetical protein [Solemya elarraichensis gill symbiont]